MSGKPYKKLIRMGDYIAEVEIVLDESAAWGPTISKEAAFKLDDVRQALREGNLAKAATLARVYHLTPVNTEAA